MSSATVNPVTLVPSATRVTTITSVTQTSLVAVARNAVATTILTTLVQEIVMQERENAFSACMKPMETTVNTAKTVIMGML